MATPERGATLARERGRFATPRLCRHFTLARLATRTSPSYSKRRRTPRATPGARGLILPYSRTTTPRVSSSRRTTSPGDPPATLRPTTDPRRRTRRPRCRGSGAVGFRAWYEKWTSFRYSRLPVRCPTLLTPWTVPAAPTPKPGRLGTTRRTLWLRRRTPRAPGTARLRKTTPGWISTTPGLVC